MSKIPSDSSNPQFPSTKICATCGRALDPVALESSPPPVLQAGSKWAAAMEEYLVLRAEYQEADRQLGESIHRKLEAAAPAAGSVR